MANLPGGELDCTSEEMNAKVLKVSTDIMVYWLNYLAHLETEVNLYHWTTMIFQTNHGLYMQG